MRWIITVLMVVGTLWAAAEQPSHFTTLKGFEHNAKAGKSEKFGSFKFQTGKNQHETVEGIYFKFRYNLIKGSESPGTLYLVRNFIEAVRQNGGDLLYETKGSAVIRMMRDQKEIWARFSTPANTKWYEIVVIERAAMTQEMGLSALQRAMDAESRATVYINFDTDSAQVKDDSLGVIEEIGALLEATPTLRLSIEGHTDHDGDAQHNQALSLARSESVRGLLLKRGIDAVRLQAKGHGASKPIAPNDTPQNKAKNRRVELVKL